MTSAARLATSAVTRLARTASPDVARERVARNARACSALGSTPFHCPAKLASDDDARAARRRRCRAGAPRQPQISDPAGARPDQHAAPPSRRDDEAVEAEQPERQRDVHDRDGAGRRVVGFLDRLVVDQQRQRDDALGADEQHDAEFVDRQQQAQAAAGEQRRHRGRQDDLAHDAATAGRRGCSRPRSGARIDEREGGQQRPQDEGRVDRHFGQDHAPGRVEEVDRRHAQVRSAADQRAVQHAGRAVEEGEGERDQEGRQRDERVDQPRDQARARERARRTATSASTQPEHEAAGRGGRPRSRSC